MKTAVFAQRPQRTRRTTPRLCASIVRYLLGGGVTALLVAGCGSAQRRHDRDTLPSSAGPVSSRVIVSGVEHCDPEATNQAASSIDDAAEKVAAVLKEKRLCAPRREHLLAHLRRTAGHVLVFVSSHGECTPQGTNLYFLGRNNTRVGEVLLADLLSALDPSRVDFAVFILNACHSAWVDLRQAKVPVAVISASEWSLNPHRQVDPQFKTAPHCQVDPRLKVDPRSKVPDAERAAHDARLSDLYKRALSGEADANQDCLVTDYELAEWLNACTAGWSTGLRDDETPYFRVARQANGHLPVRRLPLSEPCRKTWAHMEEDVRRLDPKDKNAADRLRELITRHIELAKGPSAKLPQSGYDYYVVDATVSDRDAKTLAERAEGQKLRRFPGDKDTATSLAQDITFADILLIEDPHYGIPPHGIPLRRDSQRMGLGRCFPDDPKRPEVIRCLGQVSSTPVEVDGKSVDLAPARSQAVPCSVFDGQCFRPPYPETCRYRLR